MAATRESISRWFDEGVKQGATHLVVMMDIMDHEDYPVHVMPGEDPRTKGRNGDRVMEVYNLSMDKERQLGEPRAFHYEEEP